MQPETAANQVERALVGADVTVEAIEERRFPGELFIVVTVPPSEVSAATAEAYALELPDTPEGESVLISVRAGNERSDAAPIPRAVKGLSDSRVDKMIELVTSHSRSSLANPSLEYIQEGQANLSRLISARHCFVFGRRGAGKTALMVEGKSRVESTGAVTVWMNTQLYRTHPVGALVTAFARLVVEELSSELSKSVVSPAASPAAKVGLGSRLSALRTQLEETGDSVSEVPAWIAPELNARLREFFEATGRQLFIFLDDFYLYPIAGQPFVLEGLHACTRDSEAWLKVASIKHLTRQWDSGSSSGLEPPHDAEAIELDLTLQDPEAATAFLLQLLESFAKRAGIASLNSVFLRRSLDRLVLASGAVPRDYLVLANQAIAEARKRSNARVVGVEDVNRAAGHASSAKRKELEEDLASESEEATATLAALSAVRAFCLDRPNAEPWSYFRVSFSAKEIRQEEYAQLTRLLELRMVHMLDASISDPKRAGARFEVYMLDLSEYTGQRLRRGVNALNFEGGRLTAQKTGKPSSRREGERARDVIGIFRRAPELDLALLSP